MSTKTKILIVSVTVLVAFAAGRYTVPEKVRTETKTVYVDKKTEDKATNEHKKVVIVKKPDGSTTTTITDDKTTDTHKTDDVSSNTDTTKEVTRGGSRLTLSALAGTDIHNFGPIYGVHASKEILGPIGVGAWGLSNGTGGLSISLTF